jgi:quercetin dioxygenase-like cupin family protein
MTTTETSETASPVLELGRRTVLHLTPDLSATELHVDEQSWAHPADVAQFQVGRVLSVFEYESSWTWWERHPVGVELVHVLSGSVVFRLRGTSSKAVVLKEAQSLVVPEGIWHTAEIVRPARLLFVTPLPARTEHRAIEFPLVDKVSHG